MKNKILLLAVISAVSFGSCKKNYFDTNPTNRVGTDGAFKDASNVYPLLSGIDQTLNQRYSTSVPFGWGLKHLHMVSDVMGNDMVGTGSGFDWFQSYYTYQGTRNAQSWAVFLPWNYCYKQINACNEVLDVIDAATGSTDIKNDIKGQALTYRAFFYWNLTQFYCKPYKNGANADAQGLPVSVLPVSKQGIDGVERHKLGVVWDRIKADIEQGVTLLENTTVKRVNKSQINYNVACGIYARILMELGEYDKAITYAEKAAQGFPLMTSAMALEGFNSRANTEFMWCSTLNDEQYNDQSINSFISFMYDGIYSYARDGNARRAMTKTLYDKIPSTDVRKQWFEANAAGDLYIQNKFRTTAGDNYVHDAVYMRAAEMYLIIAEAYMELGNRAKAIEYLDMINNVRNSEVATYPTSNTAFRRYVREQKRIELWGEGFGFYDVKRWGDGLSRPISQTGDHKSSICVETILSADDPKMLFYLPLSEIDNNKKMSAADQNP